MKSKKSTIEKYYTYETKSGLKTSFIKREASSSFHMALLVNFGGSDTSFIKGSEKKFIKTPRGIAHFLEHKMFETKEKNIFERFSSQSASINAYTNGTATVYYFSCTDKIKENINLFLGCLSNPYITRENVEKEKGIIIQEINMYKDNPSAKMYENMLNAMYHKNPIKYDVAGSEEDVNSTTFELLMECYDTFYNSKNMEIFAVGEIDENELFSEIERADNFKGGEKALKIYPSEPIKVVENKVEDNMPVFDTNFLIGLKIFTRNLKGREVLKRDVMYNMMLEYMVGNISKLYESLYKEGIVDPSFSYGVNLHTKFGFNLIGGISKKPEYVLERFFEEYNNVVHSGIDEKSFNSMKKMMLGNYTRIFDDPFALLNNAVTARNRGACFLEITDIVESISIDEVYLSLKESFGKERSVLSIVKPI